MKSKGKKTKLIRKSILDILPEREYDKDNKCFRLEDGTYIDILQIQSKDLINASEDEVEYDCLKFAKTYRLYSDDIKILCLNFPCDYGIQKRHLEYKLNSTKNEIFRGQLEKKLQELIWLEKHDTIREYFFMIFADSLEQMEKNRLTIYTNLGKGRGGLIEQISETKKIQVFSRIRNKSSLVNN